MTPGSAPTPFRATVVTRRGPAVLRLAGELDYATAGQLADALREVAAQKPAQLVVDAQDLEFADVAGLKPLLDMCSRMPRGAVQVRGARRPVARLLSVLELSDLLG